MENPATWNEVEKTISEALSAPYHDDTQQIHEISRIRTIYNALKTRGYLKDKY